MVTEQQFEDIYKNAWEKAGNGVNSNGFSKRETIRLIHDIAQELVAKGRDVQDAIPDYDGVVHVTVKNPYKEYCCSYVDILVNQDKPMKCNDFVPITETAQISIRMFKEDVDKLIHPFGKFAGKHWMIGYNYLGQNIYNFGTFRQDMGTTVRVVNKFNTVIDNWKEAIVQNRENFRMTLD